MQSGNKSIIDPTKPYIIPCSAEHRLPFSVTLYTDLLLPQYTSDSRFVSKSSNEFLLLWIHVSAIPSLYMAFQIEAGVCVFSCWSLYEITSPAFVPDFLYHPVYDMVHFKVTAMISICTYLVYFKIPFALYGIANFITLHISYKSLDSCLSYDSNLQ